MICCWCCYLFGITGLISIVGMEVAPGLFPTAVAVIPFDCYGDFLLERCLLFHGALVTTVPGWLFLRWLRWLPLFFLRRFGICWLPVVLRFYSRVDALLFATCVRFVSWCVVTCRFTAFDLYPSWIPLLVERSADPSPLFCSASYVQAFVAWCFRFTTWLRLVTGRIPGSLVITGGDHIPLFLLVQLYSYSIFFIIELRCRLLELRGRRYDPVMPRCRWLLWWFYVVCYWKSYRWFVDYLPPHRWLLGCSVWRVATIVVRYCFDSIVIYLRWLVMFHSFLILLLLFITIIWWYWPVGDLIWWYSDDTW